MAGGGGPFTGHEPKFGDGSPEFIFRVPTKYNSVYKQSFCVGGDVESAKKNFQEFFFNDSFFFFYRQLRAFPTPTLRENCKKVYGFYQHLLEKKISRYAAAMVM